MSFADSYGPGDQVLTVAQSSPSPDTRHNVGLSTKLFYGFGSVAFGVKDNGFSFLLLLFYNQVLGLPATTVGLALFIALVFDAAVDPIIGHFSDNLRTPWGRRHPLMYAAALPVAVSYMALWNPPQLDHQGLFYYLVGMAILIRLLISVYEVPSSALAAEFSTGYDERSSLLSYRYFFAWVGGLAIALLAFAVLLTPDATHPVGQLNPAGYARYGVVASIVIFLAIVISSAGTHRFIPNLRAPPAKRKLTVRQTVTEMAETLNNRSFLFLLAASFSWAMATGLGASLNSYFNTFFWGFSAKQISILTAGVFISAFLALFAAPSLSKRFGKRTTAIALIILSVLVGTTPLVLRVLGLFPANGTPQLLSIIFVTSIVGTAFGIVASTLVASMIADVVEAAELKTKRRSEGLFFAASAFVSKSVSGFGILAAAAIIDGIGLGSGTDPAHVPASVLRHLALVYVPSAITLYGIGLILILGYKITRSSHAETLKELAAEAERATHTG
jgi:GPH family glycoside/pentoside/hexuronide:cation symporter